MARSVKPSPSGMCRAERRWFEHQPLSDTLLSIVSKCSFSLCLHTQKRPVTLIAALTINHPTRLPTVVLIEDQQDVRLLRCLIAVVVFDQKK